MATIGIGSKLSIESETPGTFVAIKGVDSMSPSLGSLAMEDSTDFDSADNAVEHDPGLLTWGEVGFEGNYSGDASQVACITAMHTRAFKKFKVDFPASVTAGGKQMSFEGYVVKFEITCPTPNKMRFSGSISVETKPVLA